MPRGGGKLLPSTHLSQTRQMLFRRAQGLQPAICFALISLCWPQRKHEPVRHSDRPDIAVTEWSESSAIAEQAFPSVVQVVVHPELGPFRTGGRQTHIRSTTGVEGLRATNHLGPTQSRRAGIAEAKRPLDPRPVPFLLGIRAFGPQLKRYAKGLPLQVKSVTGQTLILQLVLYAHPDFKAFTGKEQTSPHACVTFRFK